jgi:hypothetical protein
MSAKEIKEECNMSSNSMSNAFVRLKKPGRTDIEYKLTKKKNSNRPIYIYRVKQE